MQRNWRETFLCFFICHLQSLFHLYIVIQRIWHLCHSEQTHPPEKPQSRRDNTITQGSNFTEYRYSSFQSAVSSIHGFLSCIISITAWKSIQSIGAVQTVEDERWTIFWSSWGNFLSVSYFSLSFFDLNVKAKKKFFHWVSIPQLKSYIFLPYEARKQSLEFWQIKKSFVFTLIIGFRDDSESRLDRT